MAKIVISCYSIFFLVQFLNFRYEVKNNKKYFSHILLILYVKIIDNNIN